MAKSNTSGKLCDVEKLLMEARQEVEGLWAKYVDHTIKVEDEQGPLGKV